MDHPAPRTSSPWAIYASLALNFLVFAVLLNTVGIVINRALDDFAVDQVLAGSLEAFKDGSIMLASLLLAPLVPLIGYRRSMVVGLLVVAVAAVSAATVHAFWILPVFYVAVGSSFALTKVSVYSTVGLLARDQRRHTLAINSLEGVFQVGSMTGPLLFSAMIAFAAWHHTFWILAGLAALALALLSRVRVDAPSTAGTAPERPGLRTSVGLLRLPMVWVFVLCASFYVMIEQSFGTWLPTFNQQVFGLTPAASAAMLSLYAGSIAAGRFLFGMVALRVPWLWLLLALIAGAFLVTAIVVGSTGGVTPLPVDVWYRAPSTAFVLSGVGLFLGPVYPTIVSAVLGRLEPERHSAMTGLIIVFSALGGTTGSLILGYLSRSFSTHDAFYFPLVPMVLLSALLLPFSRLVKSETPPKEVRS